MAKKLIVTRTVEYEFEVPFTMDYYPSGTIADAVKSEKEKDWKEVLEELRDGEPPYVTTSVLIDDDEEDSKSQDDSGDTAGTLRAEANES